MKRAILLLWGSTLMWGCATGRYHQPPAEMLMHPGPGVDGPGPGVMGGSPMRRFPVTQAQVFFSGPEGTAIAWESGGAGQFSPPQITAPGRYNFPTGSLYRLKLVGIPSRPGMELYPTLEIAPSSPKTDAYLTHNPIPVGFSDEDIDQILAGNYVTKVVFLPDPQYQELAIAGVETLVSTRLEPGVDPVVEADRRGTVMAVIRAGNIDLETPGQPSISAAGLGGPVNLAGHSLGGDMMMSGSAYGSPMPGMMGSPADGLGPSWGVPMSATPIGLPGPPHIPLGGPAGLKKHTIRNFTRVQVPGPVEEFGVNVKHKPGIRVPRPVRSARIVETNRHPHLPF